MLTYVVGINAKLKSINKKPFKPKKKTEEENQIIDIADRFHKPDQAHCLSLLTSQFT